MRTVLMAALVWAGILAAGVAQAPNPDSHYQLGPDSLPQEGVPKGDMRGPFTLPSQVYPGTQHTYWIYVPAQYDPKTAASLIIFNDGQAFKNMDGDSRAPNVLDNLIYRRELPVMIGVFINPGRRPDQPEPTPQNWGDRDTNRPTEYNSLDDKYARVIVDELMPVLYREYNISKDPDRHGIGGASSGAIAAFTVAWQRPNDFRKVFSIVGSFTNLRGGHQYADIVRGSEKKPIRIYLQDGRNDNRGQGREGKEKYDEQKDWFLQNVKLMHALADKGYDLNYTWGIGKHGQKQGGAILPDMLRWLWRDQPVSTDPNDAVERSFNDPPVKKASADGFDQMVKPFLAQNCFTCHGNEKHKRDLNFEAIASARTLVDDHDRWETVVQKLRGREMPPDDEEQPPEHQRQAVAEWIAAELARLDRVTPVDPGRVTARRLNRAEYNNTVRDLLGVDLQPADEFPQDDSGYGFDNIGDVLSLSPALMEKYMTAAERVSRAALFGVPKMTPTLTRLRSEGRRTPTARVFPSHYDETGLSLPNAFHTMTRIPADGEYVFKVGLGGIRPAGSEPITVTLWIDDRQTASLVFDPEQSARFDDDRQAFGGQAVQFRTTLTSGDHSIAASIPRVFEGLPARYGGPNSSTRPEPAPKPFSPPPSATPDRIAQLRKQYEQTQDELKNIPLDGVRVAGVEIGGPYAQVTGPSQASLARVYTCGHLHGPHQPWCARRIMTDLARRAFRRPVTPAEVEQYVALVRQAQKDEGSFDEGLAVGIQALLVSPDFLFRIERNRPPSSIGFATAAGNGSMQPVTQHELATRLSYFLWSSMPDEALRRAADAGTLRQPAVLAAQVHRMLRDPKSHALAEQFGGQWLQFRALESVTRDRERFPEFDDDLRLSMRRETELFIEHLIQEDRSILDFISANYSFLNERLARHYGIDGVSGPEFRRVDLTGTPRGGVLTQASVLTVSSYATRTSPVLRGKWILENLLNAPPPAPPADVPNLDETKIGTAASMREQLTAHRRDPTCAVCHKRMDPLGFGMENFDAVGKWRTADGNFPIDAHGTLPDGDEFDGPVELRGILAAQREAFARCLTSKLLTYALGRGLEKYDSLTVRRIAERLPQADYRFSALVLEIVNSAPFQYRRPIQDAQVAPRRALRDAGLSGGRDANAPTQKGTK